jgi:23S rRNA pseudouridine2457 synthase
MEQEIPHRYFILNKPFNMVSQFVSTDEVPLLTSIDFNFPEGTHAIGRLDAHSEGLLILTTNKKVTRLLFQGKVPHKRTYLVQVLQHMTQESVQKIRDGVSIRIKGNVDWTTTPCEAEIVEKPADLFLVENALQDFIPHTWLTISLTEGKFHQVRKMVLALRHKCRRLIRMSIEDIHLEDLQPGCVREMNEVEFFKKLKIDYP